ncbi:MAG TPA: hypothetical protein VFS42_03615 [Burkholderiaceae bacterium]|nr:hypothetical protein [Burkholderiaceae bacterium]
MWMLALEAVLALSLLLFIVWWTMSPPKKKKRRSDERAPTPSTRADDQ